MKKLIFLGFTLLLTVSCNDTKEQPKDKEDTTVIENKDDIKIDEKDEEIIIDNALPVEERVTKYSEELEKLVKEYETADATNKESVKEKFNSLINSEAAEQMLEDLAEKPDDLAKLQESLEKYSLVFEK